MATLVADTIEDTQVFIGGTRRPSCSLHPARSIPSFRSALAEPTAQVQVLYQGQPTASATVPVQPASPAVFSHEWHRRRPGSDPQPGRQRQLPNQSSLARLGGGSLRHRRRTHHARQRGWSSHSSPPYPTPMLPVSVTIDGLPAQVALCGSCSRVGCRSVADQCGGACRRSMEQPTIRSSSRSATMPAQAL